MPVPTTRKRHGRHYTPPELAGFLARRGAAYLPPGERLRILDPACGDGELLLAAATAAAERGHEVGELAGLDLDADAVGRACQRLAGVAPPVLLSVEDFTRAPGGGAPLGRFDLIITNPPYVRTQVLGAEVSRQLAARFQLHGRIDLTHAFVAAMRQLLAPGGVIALLCSNRFLSTRAGLNTRRLLGDGYLVHEVYDLGDTKLFEAAVLPAIVIGERRGDRPGADPPARFTRIYEAPRGGAPARRHASVLAALDHGEDGRVAVGPRNFVIETGELVGGDPRDPWRLGRGSDARWFADVMAGCWKTYGEIARIRVGIKTTADAVFIRENWDDLPEHERPEPQLLMPLITHHDARAWRINPAPAAKVLYPYDLTADRRTVLPLAGYPRARTYLAGHEERLRGRRYVADAGRAWYEIWVPQRPALWRKPKLVFPDISEKPRFAIDSSGAVVNGDCYWISCEDLPSMDLAYLMLAVANSSLGVRFYDIACGNRLYSGKRRWITQYVAKLPLPDPASVPARRAAGLARDLSGPGAAAGSMAAALAELDDLVGRAFLGARGQRRPARQRTL
jgi:adenine-specific DNA-methyltransferase